MWQSCLGTRHLLQRSTSIGTCSTSQAAATCQVKKQRHIRFRINCTREHSAHQCTQFSARECSTLNIRLPEAG